MTELTVVVPSRGRPSAVKELAQAFIDTCVSKTQLVVAVDDDDPTLDEYIKVSQELESFELTIGLPNRIGPILNEVVPVFAAVSDNVGFMGDDHRPRTIGWDAAYITALRDMGTGVVYGDDLLMGIQIPTQVAMTSNIVLATGHFVPDGMKHLWLDNAWKAIGEATSLRYLPQVVVEHMHPLAGKGEWDESYLANNTDAVFDADKIRFLDWQANELPEWVRKIEEYNRA
jgi:hypothetical protein